MTRKLATIRTVKEIKPIAGADNIEVAVIDGWEVVVKKSEMFKTGELVVYIEIDSIVPEREEFEFLRDRKFRVRTIKLRGQVSQGLALPLSVTGKNNLKEGDDVTELLKIKKYDPEGEKEQTLLQSKVQKQKNPIKRFLLRFAFFRRLFEKPKKGGFPAWIVKTDEERIQNKTRMFEEEKALGTKFMVTEKIDGQSATYFLERRGRKYKFGVCSRNVYLPTPNDSSYWTIAKQLDIETVLKSLIGNNNRIVLQGEILGEGIQGNKYGVKGYDFYAFNLILPNKKMNTVEIQDLLKPFGIKTVKVIAFDELLCEDVPSMVEFAKGKSLLAPVKREGLVWRNNSRNISFKVINPEFLLAEND